MRVDQKYIKNGFLLFETDLKNNLKKIRKKIIAIFNPFFFPKRKWIKSPRVNFATYFPYKK